MPDGSGAVVARKGSDASDHSSAVMGSVAMGSMLTSEDISKMSASELRTTVKVLEADLDDVQQLVTPLKVENARLAGIGRTLSGLVQEVVHALRDFFADKQRREWFKTIEDEGLGDFLQVLIRWYRRIAEDDNPTLAFYKRVWEYERSDDLRTYSDADDGRSSSSEARPGRGGRRPSHSVGGSGSGGDKAGDGDASDKQKLVPGPTSSALYDACRARSETNEHKQTIAKLRDEADSLRYTIAALEHEVRTLQEAPMDRGGPPSSRPSTSTRLNGSIRPDSPRKSPELRPAASSKFLQPAKSGRLLPEVDAGYFAPTARGSNASFDKGRGGRSSIVAGARTLAQMAATDPRWRRLLDDPEQLFSSADVIDDTYEEYLSDILVLMEKHKCDFKKAIEYSAEAAMAASPGATSSIGFGSTVPGGPGSPSKSVNDDLLLSSRVLENG